jgi:acyl-coenzyme A thioesterase PaaI-like protein
VNEQARTQGRPEHHAKDAEVAQGVGGIDGITRFMGMRWEDAQTVWLTIRPELINRGGLLSGVVTYALVDYCMGSTLWAQTSELERIATINIAINYVQTATEGEIVCRTVLDRRNRTNAVMRSEVRHADGRLLVTAIGSYTIFVPRELRGTASGDGGAAGSAPSAGGAAGRAPSVDGGAGS